MTWVDFSFHRVFVTFVWKRDYGRHESKQGDHLCNNSKSERMAAWTREVATKMARSVWHAVSTYRVPIMSCWILWGVSSRSEVSMLIQMGSPWSPQARTPWVPGCVGHTVCATGDQRRVGEGYVEKWPWSGPWGWARLCMGGGSDTLVWLKSRLSMTKTETLWGKQGNPGSPLIYLWTLVKSPASVYSYI